NVCHKQVLPTITVEVRRVDAHSGPWGAVIAKGNSRLEANFFEGAVAFIDEQEVGHRVVRNEQVGPTIVVYVRGNDSERLAWTSRDAGTGAHIFERAIPVVVKKEACPWFENSGNAVIDLS